MITVKKVNLLKPVWWNPLCWLYVILAPVVSAIVGIFYGMAFGYERGLATSSSMIRKINRKLP